METKEEVIKRFGKNDGFDEDRWKGAIQMSGEIDCHVNTCFVRLLKLEDDGIIGLSKDERPPMENITNGHVYYDDKEKCLCFLKDGVMKQYPTLEQFAELVELLDVNTKPSFVQSLAQDAFKAFTEEWTAGKYKDKGINMESVFLMGYHLGYDKKETSIYKEAFEKNEVTSENFSEKVKEGLGQCLNGENTLTEMELVDGVAQEVSSGK